MQWVLSFDEFVALAYSRRDSGCGPDGIPYSAWTCGLKMILRPLYEIYLALLHGTPPPVSMSRGFLLCILKAEMEGDDAVVARAPDETRPLTLSDSDGKFISGAVDSPISTVAQHLCKPHQRGSILGGGFWLIMFSKLRLRLLRSLSSVRALLRPA